MPIDVGSQLGAYEVLSLLGEGGMGRVFRARDTRLKRDVAIKALPAEFAIDPDRLSRFRREAEALAAVNHPHIAGIHDVIESGGSQFLVLELVDGETLADRIQRGPIPVPEAIGIARQTAEALEAAHDRGIVHRDLKPANIKITQSGVVKVLDFGLAKVFDPADRPQRSGPARARETESPTFTSPAMTLQGVILGTAAYMSPEQARGQQVDTQADVWGLGCVLYEMLTGRRPFTGPTVTDVLAAVVRADPDWSALPVDAPRSVRDVLRRCLQKDTTRRLHHIADVRIELEDAVNESAASGEQAPPLRVTSRRAWLVAAVMGALAIGSIAWAFAFRSPAAPELRLEITTPPSPDPIFLALSPDGQTLAFVASDGGVQRIWLRSLSDTTPRPLPGTELAIAPFWSPDSRSLGFFADGKLKRIDLAGGATQTLASAPLGIGGSWNRNGDIVFAPSAVGGLYRVSANGGQAAAVTRVQAGETGHRLPHFLPDARHFVFYAQGTPTTRGIFVGDLDGTPVRRLIEASSSGVVTAGRLLFVREGALFSQPFDVHRQQLSGEASAVVDGIAFDGTTSAAALSVTPDGLLAYRTGGASGQRQLSWVDRAGRITGTLGAPDTASLFNPELSPDGKRVAINRTLDAPQDIWHMEVARGVLSRFTFHEQSDQIPVWSSDGQRVIFSSNRKGAYDLYEKPASGAREEQLLFESPQNKFAMGLSPDGRFLLYRNTAENTDWDLWVLPLDGDTSQSRKPVPVAQTSAQEMMGEFSPDGRWIAYQSNESGQYEIYVRSFPELSARVQISTDGGAQPRWRRDGKELFYIGLDGRLMAAPITFDTQGTLQVAAPIALFMTRTPGGPVPSPQKQQYAVAPDGQLFLINSLPAEATASPVTLVLNWNPERR